MPDTNQNTPAGSADLRVDRSYIADRNRAIIKQLRLAVPISVIAKQFGLSHTAVKKISLNLHKFPDADVTYLATTYAKPYSEIVK